VSEALIAILAVGDITDLTDHDNIRGLPQHGAEGGREGHADLFTPATWLMPVSVVLDRILDRDQFPIRLD
jgi:hypothetical protein